MITFPKSKINMGLRVIGKRPDGYHDIETIFYPVDFCDALEFVAVKDRLKDDSITVTGDNLNIRPENNLVIKAFRKLREHFDLPFFKIHLHKVIPNGAGLGGGSSDAACVIRSVNKYFKLSMDNIMMKNLAGEIGSDCPFFIDPIPSLASGRGEILKHVNPVLYGFRIVLINPKIQISTREAYLNTPHSKPEKNLEYIYNQDITEWKNDMVNDFEDFVFRVHPQIEECKNILYKAGALFSSMSGSGSTVYGIFEGKPVIPGQIKQYVVYEGLL